jgi:hypothetical protein
MYKTITIHTRSVYWSDKETHDEMYVDSDDLSKELEQQCNKLDVEGYEIISILPVNSGNTSGGTGYFYTESIIVTGKKKI